MEMKFGTKAVHAGVEPDPTTGAIMTPIYQTSTYVQESPAKHKGYAYARGANPTRNTLQKSIAALENGKHGICFSSGMGATDAVIKLLAPGDEVITSNDLYGGSYRMFKRVYEKFGIKFHFIDLTKSENLIPYLNSKTKLLWLETPSNPLMRIIDIEACVALVKKNKVLVAVDNTFASPYLQNPLALGADIVMHSVTKYLGGHSDVIMGALVALPRPGLYCELVWCGARATR
jgi:cystathionine gamma-lyase